MANARALLLCDEVAALILAGWNASATPPASIDGVQRAYSPTISFTPDSAPQIEGRQVYVFPMPYTATPQTRETQLRDYLVKVLVVEQYSAAEGDPPTAWIDERVNFCEQVVFNPLMNPQLVIASQWFPPLETEGTVDVLYDQPALQENKAFWSVMTLPFQEQTLWTGEIDP